MFKKKMTEDIGLPEPLEAAKKPMGMMKPNKPAAPTQADIDHEQGEKNLDFGMIGEKFGLTPEESSAFAYDIFEACMKASGGAAHEEQEPEAKEEEPNESDTENYPA